MLVFIRFNHKVRVIFLICFYFVFIYRVLLLPRKESFMGKTEDRVIKYRTFLYLLQVTYSCQSTIKLEFF